MGSSTQVLSTVQKDSGGKNVKSDTLRSEHIQYVLENTKQRHRRAL